MTTTTLESNQLPIITDNSFKSEKKNRIKYNVELLCDIIERDDCGIDIFFYEKITLCEKSNIYFICNCKEIGNKEFRHLYKKGGAFCNKCTKNNRNKKFIKTNLDRTGFEYPLQSNITKEKKKETCLNIYGFENPMQSDIIKDKKNETCLNLYGFEHPIQSEIIKEKRKELWINLYGFEHPMQNPEIAEKSNLNARELKKYITPSGNILLYQGYENHALDELIFKEGIDEYDIFTSKKDVPEIFYEDSNRTSHRYYTDIYIKSQNKCIEVKSEYTLTLNPEIIQLKEEAVKKNGYKYEIRIYDKKKNRIIIV